MQSGSEAVELLTARDFKEASRLSQAIDQYNKDRKQLDKQITDGGQRHTSKPAAR